MPALRTVVDPYARLFAVPGARAFFLAGALARLPMATVGLGAVFLVAGRSGSYALAGAVSGTLALALAVSGPQWARLMDRRGQGVVLQLASVGYLLLGLGFAAAVVLDAPRWAWFVLAAATGSSEVNIGSVVRSRWAHALPEGRQRQTAFALESVADELIFVVGPPLVTVLAASVSPPAGFVAGLLAGVAGALALSGQRGTQPPAVRAVGRLRRRAVVEPALLVVTVTYLAVGAVFGAMDVVVVGFAAAEGRPSAAGGVLAVYAAGSLIAGLAYGALPTPGSLTARFLGCAVLFGLAGQAFLAVGSLSWLVPSAFLAGLAIAPLLVSGMSLVESRMDRGAVNEGLAWTSTGLTLGVTAGAASAGAAVDRWGAAAAFTVPAAAAGTAALLALAGAGLIRRPG